MQAGDCGRRGGHRLLAVLALLLVGLPHAWARHFVGTRVKVAEYTTNSICIEKNCINPIFPGIRNIHSLNVLDANQNRSWACAKRRKAWESAGFCKRIVDGYHFSLPVPTDGKEHSEKELVQQQEKLALEAYVAHITGMGHDLWSYTEPSHHDKCIQAVWKMVCHTHFPRCNKLTPGQYLRPCGSSCTSYLRECKVSCCDEGVQCVFKHERQTPDGTVQLEQGYINHAGPSPLCTGAASPLARPLPLLAALLAVGAAAAALESL